MSGKPKGAAIGKGKGSCHELVLDKDDAKGAAALSRLGCLAVRQTPAVHDEWDCGRLLI
uniref:Uncharacterized protein n=1 Tax=Cucumis sativus TaxID=3659 RepID=A0A0A0LUM6_CUCSA